ncbi:MAG: RNA 3'-phosphate cyclase, partial [Candidatus Latescibacteria bacterium]|nr:RNA 3'-phosphate cyclase [Candidatus Latescibacterota bacterium]
LTGGLFQDFAPSAFHMQSVLLPMLRKMGIRAQLAIARPGYVPKGGGIIELSVEPIQELHPLVLGEQGKLLSIKGIALSSHLKDKKVSERMARACQSALKTQGYVAEIEIVYDDTAPQEGAALALFAETDQGAILGADMAGRVGRRSEEIGRKVAQMLMEDLQAESSVDRYAADQVILFAALARGKSRFKIPRITEHVETNLWLVEEILGAKVSLEHHWIEIDGPGFEKLAHRRSNG